jgi:hypothetical protein
MLSNPESQANVPLGVQIGRYSPAPSVQSVRNLWETPPLGSDRSGLGETLDRPFFRPDLAPSRHAKGECSCVLPGR